MSLEINLLRQMTQQERWIATHLATPQEIQQHRQCQKEEYFKASNAYIGPTDNLKDMLALLDSLGLVRGKEIMTILGSGDFLLGFLLNNAYYVTAIDISSIGCMWGELKTQMWENLPYQLLDTFCSNIAYKKNPHENREIYQSVKPMLSESSCEFFDIQMQQNPLLSGLFVPRPLLYEGLPYEDNSAAPIDVAGRSMILNLDLLGFIEEVDHEYDLMFLTNVIDKLHTDKYRKQGVPKPQVAAEQAATLDGLKGKLSKNGVIVSYVFSEDADYLDVSRRAADIAGLSVEFYHVPKTFFSWSGQGNTIVVYR